MRARTGCTTRAARFLCRRPYCPGRGWGAGWRGRPDKTDKREVTRTTFPLNIHREITLALRVDARHRPGASHDPVASRGPARSIWACVMPRWRSCCAAVRAR